MGEVVAIRRFTRPPDLNLPCTDERLMQGIQLWLLGGEITEVARILKVPSRAMHVWVRKAGWRSLCAEYRVAVSEVAHGEITRITHKAFAALEKRIDEGDPIINEGAVTGYAPVAAKGLAVIVGTLHDRAHEIEKRLSIVGEMPEDRLELGELLQSLKRFAQAKEIQG